MQFTYNTSLVALSVGMAWFASFIVLKLLQDKELIAEKGWWLKGASITLGSGIWCMHFIGMLALQMPVALFYNIPLTLLSLLMALGGSYVGLGITQGLFANFFVARHALLVGALLMGASVGAMHFTGMAALTIFPPIRYDAGLVALSLLIAFGASYAALLISQRRRQFEGQGYIPIVIIAFIMSLAVSGMHYTAMAAAHFPVGAICRATSMTISAQPLIAMVGGVCLLLLTLAILTLLAKSETSIWIIVALILVGEYAIMEALDRAGLTQSTPYLSKLFDGLLIVCLVFPVLLRLKRTTSILEVEKRQFQQSNLELLKLKRAVEQAQVTIVVTDKHGSIEYVNPSFTKTTGYTTEEAIGKNPRVLKSGFTSPEEYQKLWETISNKQTWSGLFHNKRKDGVLYWEQAVISPVLDSKGAITSFVAVKENITTRLAAEEELREASQYVRSLIEASLDPLVTISPEGKITDVNKATEEATGVGRDSLIGSDFYSYFTEPEQARQGYQLVFSQGSVTDYPLAIRHFDGHVIDVLYNASVYRNQRGEIEGVFAAARDITTAKENERFKAFLHEGTEAKFKVAEILQHADRPLQERMNEALSIVFQLRGLDVQQKGGIFLFDPHEKVLNLNATCGKFTQQFLQDEQTVPLGRCLCGRAAQSGEIIVSDNCFEDHRHENRWPNMQPHGHYIIPLMMGKDCLGVMFLYTETNPDKNPARLDMLGQIGGLFSLAIMNDKVHQAMVAARTDAESMAKFKSEFLANMSHEIRTPMNAIIGLSHLALNLEVPGEVRDYLDKINSSSESLLGILNDILDFSKLEAGKFAIENVPFNLGKVKETLLNLFSARAEQKHLAFSVEVDPNVPIDLNGDALRLQQILSNLIGNALKFTERGEVKLEIKCLESDASQARLRFCVSDTGIGMRQESIDKLFQPFSQADTSITRRFGGTGLGLAISHGLLQLMGGEFTVESQIGKGTCFYFELNLEIAAPGTHQETNRRREERTAGALGDELREQGQKLKDSRILVAEDNKINQMVVKEFLKLSGIEVDIANNGVEALEYLRDKTYDAVLMDVHMPEMGGVEATEIIRKQPQFTNLPIIALTAGVTEEERVNCMACGMNDFVTKPIRPEELIAALLHWVGKVS